MNIINKSINDSAWTAVSLNVDSTCRSYGFQSRSGGNFKIKKNEDDTDYLTIRDGGMFSVNEFIPVSGSVLFYAQTVSGDDVIEGVSTENF